jgi:hypothetical protein
VQERRHGVQKPAEESKKPEPLHALPGMMYSPMLTKCVSSSLMRENK